MSQRNRKTGYYLEEWKSKPCCNSSIKVNRTVYVSVKYGHDQGKLNDPSCPFSSITAAINAIKDKLRTVDTQWEIQITPGVYNESVIVPQFINLIGADPNLTLVKSLFVVGTSNISNLTINGETLPLITTQLNRLRPEENVVEFNNIKVSAMNIANTNNNSVILITGIGLNNTVTFKSSDISGTVLQSNPESSTQTLFDVQSDLTILNTNIAFAADYKAPISCMNFRTGANATINGGTIRLTVNEGPSQEVSLFQVDTAGLTLINNTATIIIMLITNPYKAYVSYIKSIGAGTIFCSNSTAFLDGIVRDFSVLLQNLNKFSNINLLGLTTPNILIPKIMGFQDNISYALTSGSADLVTNGSLYTNIVKATGEPEAEDYYIQENDFTVLSDKLNIIVPDPVLVTNLIIKGKLLIIKNIGDAMIMVNGDNNSIFDGPQTLQPNQSIMLQNNGTLWYKISN